MSRYIDADKLKLEIRKDIHKNNDEIDISRFWDVIDNQPAADVGPVVRCKDCIGKNVWYKNKFGYMICGLSGTFVVDDNGFCSYGERKEGAEK